MNEEYISLQLSPFYVRCDEDYHGHVYVRGQEELVEVTKELTAEQKNVLIEDLIYAISELLKDKNRDRSVDRANPKDIEAQATEFLAEESECAKGDEL